MTVGWGREDLVFRVLSLWGLILGRHGCGTYSTVMIGWYISGCKLGGF